MGRRSKASGGYRVGPGTVVTLSYQLLDAEGDVVEASEPGEPLEILFGFAEAPPRVEQALDGCAVGQAKEVVLPPDEAFGERDPDALIYVDPAELPPGAAPGDEFEAEGPDGAVVPLKVVDIGPDSVVLDTNHPLAGQKVRLRLTVLAVGLPRPERVEAATARLEREAEASSAPLLPAERLLRRRRPEPSAGGDEPPGPIEGPKPVEKR